jgi:hypothetical protein
MLQLAWLLFRESDSAADRKLAGELADAARHLHECRMRHHGPIPMCVAPAALAGGDAKLMRRVPQPRGPGMWTAGRHYVQALYAFTPGALHGCPGFADDQQYRYYYSIARTGGKMTRALAFKIIADAYTEPMLYRFYSDDDAVPAGINGFDLYPYRMKDGKPTDYRSDRKGPGGRPKPIGSRMGPQNMICCGWALQCLRAYPGIWEEPHERRFGGDARVYITDPPPGGGGRGTGASSSKPAVTRVSLGGAELGLAGLRNALWVSGRAKGETLTLRIYARPDGKGTYATVTVSRNGVAAVNDKGRKLLVEGKAKPAADGVAFQFSLPYTVVKGQKAWANGVEHGRYSIAAGGIVR